MTGCAADGPLYQLSKLNPVFRKQWDEDRQLGPIFEDRRAELNKLQGQLASMEPQEQDKWIGNLEKLLQYDPSADMRRDAVLCLKNVSTPKAYAVLNLASQDENDKVRLAVCDVLGEAGDPQAITKLGQIATTEKELSVRVAAIRNLGRSSSEDAKTILARTIEDKSPSIQFETTLALQKNTGKSLGGDVATWKRYLQGEEVQEPSYMATQWNEWLGTKK